MTNNVFKKETVDTLITRINKLNENSKPIWGKMNTGQMLAHCNVTYEMVYTDKHPKPNMFIGFILKKLVKKKVVSDKPFNQNGKTAPQFIIKESKVFLHEKSRLIDYLTKTQELGPMYFDGKDSHSFGPLNLQEWNNLFYKHLNHHLNQFGY